MTFRTYGYNPIATIKDYDEEQLDKRIEGMKERGYELLSKQSRNNYYSGVVHYAKLKKEEEE